MPISPRSTKPRNNLAYTKMSDIPQVEGLTMLTGPRRSRMAGSKFALPPGFDSKKFASKWVERGPGVQEAEQPVVLDFANCQAQGWSVFKVTAPAPEVDSEEIEGETEAPKAKRKLPPRVPFTRAVGKNVYVLMFRPKNLQRAVNTLYANQSRQIVDRELLGHTNSANESQDPGMLTNADLKKHSRDLGDEPEGYIPARQGPKPDEATELQIN